MDIYKLYINGKDFTKERRLLSFKLNDNTGVQSDVLLLEFDDSDNLVKIPREGDKIRFYMGLESGFVDWGIWEYNDYSGTSNGSLNVKCTPFNTYASLRSIRNENYESSLFDVVKEIADRAGMAFCVYDALKNYEPMSFYQKSESDLNFLSRICKEIGAYFKIKNNTICILERCSGKTETGKNLGSIQVSMNDIVKNGLRYRGGRGKRYKRVEAYYYDDYKGISNIVGVGDEFEEPLKTLVKSYKTEQEALKACEAEFKSYELDAGLLHIRLLKGNPRIKSETPIDLVGFKPGLNGRWYVDKAEHTGSRSGLQTSIQCIRRAAR